MSNYRRFRNFVDAWKVRPIHGFEKYLFSNNEISLNNAISPIRSNRKHNVDPARFIYPRDAMGNLLTPLGKRTSHTSIPLYLPKYDFIKIRSPIWTIKNVHHSKENIHRVGPMTYNSVNDKSQLPCKFGWTQIGRKTYNNHSRLILPFYDTRKYKQVGNPYSVCFNFLMSR
ncbi:unnamed protein product [Rotaria magnacalcarata]|uniref:Uncharacterized protein n=1 Tax=Rotaria magnacalcarata TaxID=392030 RepID=A0A815ZWE4_9BILA|nr:unnamed protein product [Rotaria magnacalcarata]CAF2080161.1 unnamed protein product [Rotaria magnacalcarata]CAF4448171.1 unnamed protein product [Rotaria magnacalcarata]